MHDKNTFHINSSEDFELVNKANCEVKAYSNVATEKIYCEALGCSNVATEKIQSEAGKYGIRDFFVCRFHVSIFEEG